MKQRFEKINMNFDWLIQASELKQKSGLFQLDFRIANETRKNNLRGLWLLTLSELKRMTKEPV